MTPKPGGVRRVVGFSGGADSQAVALWVRQRFPAEEVVLLNSQAGGNEHPLTVGFIQWYSDNVFPVTVVTPLIRDLGRNTFQEGRVSERRQSFPEDAELTFDRLAWIKNRFPSRKAQFCTEYLKLAPLRRWMRENLYTLGVDAERYIGVRADESAARAGLPERQWDDYHDCELLRPLLRWTKAQVFDFLKAHGEEVNPLYKLGFARVGCAPCINSNKQDVRNWAARFPEMIDKVRAWEQAVGRSFFPPHVVPGKTVAFVDEVVEWSKTERGGRQYGLPFFEAEAAGGGCVSRYGLCE